MISIDTIINNLQVFQIVTYLKRKRIMSESQDLYEDLSRFEYLSLVLCCVWLVTIHGIAYALRLGPTRPVTNFWGWQMSSS